MEVRRRNWQSVDRQTLGRLLVVAAPALLAAAIAVRVALLLDRVARTVAYPFQFDPTEGILLSEFVLLNQRVNIYAPFTAEQFISAPYPPLYYLLVAPLLRLTGVNFVAGRLIALLATAAIVVLIAALVAQRTPAPSGRGPALLAAGLWLASLPVLVWATRLKPDLVAVAFNLLGLLLLERRPGRLLLPIACFTLAFYSKQSAVAGSVAAGLWLLSGNWRHAVRFGLWQFVALAVPFALLDLLTRHGFWIHMVDYHALPWSARHWLQIAFDVASFHWVLAGLALVYVVRNLRIGTRGADGGAGMPLLAIYIVVALLASFSAGTFGGFHNHALELLAALCLGTGLLAAALWAQPRLRTALLAVALIQVLGWSRPPAWLHFEVGNVPDPVTTRRLQGIQAFVGGQTGPVWGDNVGLIVMAGRPVRFNDPLIMAQAAMLGWWDERTFVRMVADGAFDALIWRADLLEGRRPNDLSPAMLAAIRQRYRILYRDVSFVYVPMEKAESRKQ